MTTALVISEACPCPITTESCPIEACPCPISAESCPIPDLSDVDHWGFKEPLPKYPLAPGMQIYSEGKTFVYEICSYPFSRVYLDFKGLTRGMKGTTPIDTPAREFYKAYFLLLLDLSLTNHLIPLHLIFGICCRISPHLDNNGWQYERGQKPVRSQGGNYLTYEVKLVDYPDSQPFMHTVRMIPILVSDQA